MRYLTLLLLFIILTLDAYSQAYECIKSDTIQFYINNDHYLRGIRIDSTKTIGANKILYPYKTARGEYSPSNHVLTPKGSWMGEKVEILPDGQTNFYTYWNDTVIIKTLAQLNDTWTMYDDTSSNYYVATIIGIDTATVLNKIDSVKTITITAFNGSGINSNDPLNNEHIILSKEYGLVQTTDLYIFPQLGKNQGSSGYDYFTYRAGDFMFRLVDFHTPDAMEVYDANIGDISQFKVYNNAPPGYLEREIIDKKIIGNNIQFVTKVVTVTYPVVPPLKPITTIQLDTSILKNKQLIGLALLPEEWNMEDEIYYFPKDTFFCIISNKYDISDNYVFYDNDTTAHANTFEPCGQYRSFKIKVGEVQFSYCIDPTSNSYSRSLTYTEKNGTPCGTRTYLDIHELESKINIEVYPNPASEEFHIKSNLDKDYSATLLNLYGRVVNTKTGKGDVTIDISNYQNGVYILQVITEDNLLHRQKIIISH